MSDTLTVVTWLWRGPYEPRHVYAVQRMVEAHLHRPYRFVCVTDQPEKLPHCETVPLWEMPKIAVRPGLPNCYVRLYAFSEKARELFGGCFVSIDLDLVITDDITPLFDTDADFKICKGVYAPYNGSMWLHRTGTRTAAWNDFDPVESPRIANDQRRKDGQRYVGSDQAWLSYKLPGEATWTEEDGVHQYLTTCWRKKGNAGREVPEGCRIMFFAGPYKPWTPKFRVMHPVLYRQYQAYCG